MVDQGNLGDISTEPHVELYEKIKPIDEFSGN